MTSIMKCKASDLNLIDQSDLAIPYYTSGYLISILNKMVPQIFLKRFSVIRIGHQCMIGGGPITRTHINKQNEEAVVLYRVLKPFLHSTVQRDIDIDVAVYGS